MDTLTVVISAYNEEKKLNQVLSSVAWADEIVVIDNESTDTTKQIAKKFTTKVFTRKNHKMLNINKNYGFEQATCTWILNLDADEVVTQELKQEIQIILKSHSDLKGYLIPRRNILFGKWIQHGLWWPDYQLRLFKKGYGKFPEKHVHEYITVKGTQDKLSQPLLHYNYESISQFFHKLDTIYTENEVENKINDGYKIAWYDVIRWPLSDFLKIYFLQEGYKDGLHGLVLALFQSIYALTIFAKIWEKQGFKEISIPIKEFNQEVEKEAKEFKYWKLTKELAEEKNNIKKLIKKLQRKSLS